MKTSIFLILTLIWVGYLGTTITKSIQLKQNCTGYLKRAADANTIETAKEQLEKSISYLEANNLITGYTSVLWKTPNEDIEFWYKNLKASQNELSKVTENTISLEKTNILMKLRETLLDSGEEGSYITVPTGLSRYPSNTIYGLWGVFSLLCFIGEVVLLVYYTSEY